MRFTCKFFASITSNLVNMQKEEIQNLVEKTLSSLDGIQKAKASPFLFEKTLNRMSSSGKKESVSYGYVWKFAVGLAIIILLNVFTYVKYSEQTYTTTTATSSTYKENLENFAKDYSMYNTTYYY